jgi:hypothetical protein
LYWKLILEQTVAQKSVNLVYWYSDSLPKAVFTWPWFSTVTSFANHCICFYVVGLKFLSGQLGAPAVLIQGKDSGID